MKKLVVSLALFVSGFVGMSQPTQLTPPIHPDSFNLNIDSVRIYMLELVNEFRAKYRIKPLQYDSSLNVGAMNHAIYLSTYDWSDRNWSHDQKDTSSPYFTYKTPSGRCGKLAGENITGNFYSKQMTMKETAKYLFKQWYHSPGHRKNMLISRYTLFGFGIALKENYSGNRIDAVQTFY